MTDDELREAARAAHAHIKQQVRSAPELSAERLERVRDLLPPLPAGLEVAESEVDTPYPQSA